jgi:tetratricopeptide (TPR) repeat protein
MSYGATARVAVLIAFAWAVTTNTQGLFAQNAFEVNKIVSPGVVLLKNEEGQGTGMVLDRTGLILTNAHVVSSPLPFECRAEVRIGDKTERKIFKKVKIIAFHQSFDMALVRIDPKEHSGLLTPVRLCPKKSEAGIDVIAIGNPGAGGAEVELSGSITKGILSGVDREYEGAKYFQTDAAINPGNSGGPLCNLQGEVIGMNTLVFRRNNSGGIQGIGFALPLYDLKTEEFVPLSKRKTDKNDIEQILAEVDLITKKIAELREQEGDTSPNVMRGTQLAMFLLTQALSQDPVNPTLYFKSGQLLRQLKNEKASRASTNFLLQSIALDPWGNQSPLYYRELGRAYRFIQEWDKAFATWKEGQSKFPEVGFLWDDLANYHFAHEQNYLEAAKAAWLAQQCPTGITAERKAAMQKMLETCQAKLKSKENEAQTLAEFISNGPDEIVKYKAAAETGRKASKTYLNESFSKLAVASSFADQNEKQDLTIKDDYRLQKPGTTATAVKPSTTTNSGTSSEAKTEFKPIPGSEDLLAGMRTDQDAVKGSWKLEKGVLMSGGVNAGIIKLPTNVPQQYDISMVVERKSGTKDLVIGFVRGEQQSAFFVDRDKLSGPNPDDRRGSYKGELLKVDTPTTVIIKVRQAGVQVLVDNAQIFLHRGEGGFDAVGPDWDPNEAGTLFLGTNATRFNIHKLYLTTYPYPK